MSRRERCCTTTLASCARSEFRTRWRWKMCFCGQKWGMELEQSIVSTHYRSIR